AWRRTSRGRRWSSRRTARPSTTTPTPRAGSTTPPGSPTCAATWPPSTGPSRTAPTCAATSCGRCWTTSSGPTATASGSARSTSTTRPAPASPRPAPAGTRRWPAPASCPAPDQARCGTIPPPRAVPHRRTAPAPGRPGSGGGSPSSPGAAGRRLRRTARQDLREPRSSLGDRRGGGVVVGAGESAVGHGDRVRADLDGRHVQRQRPGVAGAGALRRRREPLPRLALPGQRPLHDLDGAVAVVAAGQGELVAGRGQRLQPLHGLVQVGLLVGGDLVVQPGVALLEPGGRRRPGRAAEQGLVVQRVHQPLAVLCVALAREELRRVHVAQEQGVPPGARVLHRVPVVLEVRFGDQRVPSAGLRQLLPGGRGGGGLRGGRPFGHGGGGARRGPGLPAPAGTGGRRQQRPGGEDGGEDP